MKSFTQTLEEMDELASFLEEDIENIQRVVKFCKENNLDAEFEIHPKAETCEESAEHTGLDIAQIVKTLVFKAEDEFIAVIAPGDERVDEEKLADLTGKNIDMAEFSEVEDITGYVVGGVSPFDLDIPVYMEESLLEYEKVRPAAGSRAVGLEISPKALSEISYVEIKSVVEH